MAEFIEVRTTVEGHERAAALADGILRAGLATSIDIDEAPPGESTWRLTLITTRRHAPALEREIRVVGGHGPIVAHPVAHDADGYPDWLTGPP